MKEVFGLFASVFFFWIMTVVFWMALTIILCCMDLFKIFPFSDRFRKNWGKVSSVIFYPFTLIVKGK